MADKNKSLFQIVIIDDKNGFKFEAKSKDFNIHEVVALLRRYCDMLEKKFLDERFEGTDVEIESGDEK